MRINIVLVKKKLRFKEGQYCISSVLRWPFWNEFYSHCQRASVMIELLLTAHHLENLQNIVSCMDENSRDNSRALLLNHQYSWSYQGQNCVTKLRHQNHWMEKWCERAELCVWRHSWNTLITLFHLNFNFDVCSRMIEDKIQIWRNLKSPFSMYN